MRDTILSWTAYGFTLLSAVGPLIGAPSLVTAPLGVGAASILLYHRQRGASRNAALAARVIALGGSVDDLDVAVAKAKPGKNTAAAIVGQSDLATMTYAQLVARLRSDGYLP